ncbi:probable indole-3-pyruvate monooxygenase YUCCA10 [Lathyrus oleraceus]|uniref:probable indole-3-pyruvate monooxygenase YUCCA10 n=1 Tax=Pisum sativum TaxID=3888 RepID=UPI0021CF61AD|nr:probable indole-3-pyruvate monooxygenase YUCCA10 [Pisum sativum]XP_050877946.1 probable indole-3-pyruvate monooxygenase YUCCA10 [Pisum sativum]XP_050877947.1 probable indole-3-pyruvate monooxygenase YUCCA10 [Pisum sativum]
MGDYRVVESAKYDGVRNKWIIEAKNTFKGTLEVYGAKFLVIASGENSEGFIPNLSGLEKFEGEVVHSKYYKSGSKYKSKDVLVVGCGNSGMEIAYDLHNCGANTSIVIRNPIHIFTRDMIRTGMCLVQYFPVYIVDIIITLQAKLKYGDLSTYGIYRPKDGPLYLKNITGKSAVIDFGTIEKIKEGAIKVVPSNIKKIEKKNVIFENNMEKEFDVIVFATGYKSVANGWLKDYHYALNENGFPKNSFPKHWKGDHGLYCAGLARKGLFGVKMDAEAIAKDIEKTLKSEN